MEVLEISLTDRAQEKRDYRNILRIKVNGKQMFSVHDGEPEDATLARDFNDCLNIIDMMAAAHKAGADGEPFNVERRQVEDL